MPDLENRDELEKQLARKLGKLQRAQLARLLELLGDPPNINNVPPEFWTEAGEELTRVVLPFSERLYLEAAEQMLASVPIGVDWGLINEAASNWARTYAYDLIKGINENTKKAVQTAISTFFERGQTMGELRDRLSRIYSPVRAEMIAQTEVTRAAVQGELSIVRELAKQGIQMVTIWQTSNDEIVCPICGPRHDKKKGDGWNDPPPAHPRCRCWVNHEFKT